MCLNNSQERKYGINLKKYSLILLALLLVAVSLGVSTQDAQAQKYGCDLLNPDMTPGQINEFLNSTQYTLTL